MGRTDLLTKFTNDIKIVNSDQNKWLVIYSFPDSKPNPHFFKKISELSKNIHGKHAYADRSQTSTFMTNDLHGAIIAVKLARHYGAHTHLYQIDEMGPRISIDPEYYFQLEKNEVYYVMKAIYYELKKRQENYTQSYYTEHIGRFLWIQECTMLPSTPMKKKELDLILNRCKYLEEEKKDESRSQCTSSFDFYYTVPILKAVRNYIEEPIHKYSKKIIEELKILSNLLDRATNEENELFEVIIRKINELLELPADKLDESINKIRIIQEIL